MVMANGLLQLSIFLYLSWIAHAQIVCPTEAQRVISYDYRLLPPTNVVATSEDAEFNPASQLFGRNNVPFNLWCTVPDNGIDHYINVTFAQPVVITGIVSSGFVNGYVNNFTVEYVIEPYGLVPYKTFFVSEIDAVFTLETPFTASQLRLSINGGIIAPSGRLCWHLVLFGCPLSEGLHLQSHLVSVSSTQLRMASSTLVQVLQSPAVQSTNTVIIVESEVVKDYQIVVIGVPVAVCTVLLVMVIVAAGVIICFRQGREKSRADFSKIPSSETLRALDNTTLYKTSAPTYPAPILVEEISREQRPLPVPFQLRNTLYENQMGSPKTDEPHPYEAVTPTRPNPRRNSMEDNPTYNIPFEPAVPVTAGRPHSIDMISNECYSFSESYANIDAMLDRPASSGYDNIGNVYEIPQ